MSDYDPLAAAESQHLDRTYLLDEINGLKIENAELRDENDRLRNELIELGERD